jgi:hypothetical protein
VWYPNLSHQTAQKGEVDAGMMVEKECGWYEEKTEV